MDYSQLTLVELRNELRKRQAKITGWKGELIEWAVTLNYTCAVAVLLSTELDISHK